MSTGIDYHQLETLAAERNRALLADADTYRRVEYGRYHSTTHALAERLGNLLLSWGRRVRERHGDVVVQIAVTPRQHGNRHVA
jgi:hypothetical protein